MPAHLPDQPEERRDAFQFFLGMGAETVEEDRDDRVGTEGLEPRLDLERIESVIHERGVGPDGFVTVGTVHSGTAVNIIPETCEMSGTIRTFHPDTRSRVVQRVRDIAERTAALFNAEAEVHIVNGYPVMINDEDCAEFVARVSRDVLGDDRVRTNRRPGMGAEDFAYYAQLVPAAMFQLGMLPSGMDAWPQLHTPWMDFNDDVLPTGIELFSEIAYRYLHEHADR